MARKIAPSEVARTLAGQIWPDVQNQRKLGPGTFDFSCSGHGGIVAVLDAADFSAAAVSVAREHAKTELVVYGFGKFTTTEHYVRESLEEWADLHGFQKWECWVGEEDCDWALLVVADPRLAHKMAEAYPNKEPGDLVQYAHECSERWNPETLAALVAA